MLKSDQPGNKQKKSGLSVSSSINYNNETSKLEMQIQFTNQSGGPIKDFDLMINKNSFGVGPEGSCKDLGITYPAPFETSSVWTVPLKVDKKNADVKNPPKHPFKLQIALKSSLDIFYFAVQCQVHSLISRENNLTKDEFKKYWDMIGAEKQFSFNVTSDQLYKGFTQLPSDVTTCMQNNGFIQMGQTTKQETGQAVLYFGAKTVNNLPLLFEVAHPFGGDQRAVTVTYKVPVLPLKLLFEDALKHIFTQ